MKKNERGITLTALVIYVTVMSAVIAVISIISTYSYNNMNKLEEESQYAVELNKFDMYFLKDIKKAESVVANEEGNKITMRYNDDDDNECTVTYEYIKNDSYCIVRGFSKENTENMDNNIKVCSKVTKCVFSQNINKIRVQLTINDKDQKDMEYVADNLNW